MFIKLKPATIVKNIESEEELADKNIMESLYTIRKLKAAVIEGDKIIEVNDINNN